MGVLYVVLVIFQFGNSTITLTYHFFLACLPLDVCNSRAYGSSSKAFLYSLYNINGYAPVKLQIKSGQTRYATLNCRGYGPIFGSGNDVQISDNAARYRSLTHCGHSYPLPPGYFSSGSSCTFYAGRYQFTATDIEVFYETTT